MVNANRTTIPVHSDWICQRATSVNATLLIASYVTSNPISELLIWYVGILLDQLLIVVKVVVEFIAIFITQADCTNLDK